MASAKGLAYEAPKKSKVENKVKLIHILTQQKKSIRKIIFCLWWYPTVI